MSQSISWLSDISFKLGQVIQALFQPGTGNSVAELVGITNSELGVANTKLDEIYTRLEHVKVDSYVNSRIVDEFGLAPLPATAVTGLLVSAFASGNNVPVIVNNPNPIPVTFEAGSVPVEVNARMFSLDVGASPGAWVPTACLSVDAHYAMLNGVETVLPHIGAGSPLNIACGLWPTGTTPGAPYRTYLQTGNQGPAGLGNSVSSLVSILP